MVKPCCVCVYMDAHRPAQERAQGAHSTELAKGALGEGEEQRSLAGDTRRGGEGRLCAIPLYRVGKIEHVFLILGEDPSEQL